LSTAPLERLRGNALAVPGDRRRLAIGLGVAVVGPVVATLLLRTPTIAARPGLAYVLAVVIAAAYGRGVAGLVAVAWSVLLLETVGDDWILAAGAAEQGAWASAAFLLVAGCVVLVVTRSHASADVAAADRSRFELLVRAGDSLSESLDIGETLANLGDVLVPALADWFSVDLVEDGAIRNAVVMHPDPSKVELARDLQRRFPADPDAPTGVPNVIRTGVSELTETIPDAMLEALIDDQELLATMRGLGLRCAMVVPLRARGHTIGAITLIGAESHERYTSEDLVLAEEIADRAALAIDTARLFEAETTQRQAALREAERIEVLQNVTATYGRAATVDEVIDATVNQGLPAAGAERATVGLVEDGHRVVIRRIAGYERTDRSYWYSFELSDPYPMSEAIVRDRPIVLTSAAEVKARYPQLQGEGDPRDHVLVCVPLSLGGSVIGAFSASYPPESTFDEGDLALLRSIGEQCAQAIDRARSRERAERAQRRLVAVSAASQALAGSLAFDATVRTIMRLAKEHLADSVALVAFDDRGPALLDQIGSPLPAGVHIGDVEELDPDRLLAEGPLALAGAADDAAATVLPLVIAGSLVGALVVRDARLDLDADDDDVLFAREIARRMARALENARLYRDRDHVARTLQQGLLPPRLPDVPFVESAALFRPAERGQEIGGDFYDVFEVAPGRWLAVVGDVCGKGAEAATLTGMVRHTLRSVGDVARPSDALAFVNRALLREELDGRFCTVAVVLLEGDGVDGARATVSVAGHPLPQLLSPDGRVQRVGRHGTLLGVTAHVQLHDEQLRLAPGDALVMYTDGVIAKDEVTGEEPSSLLAMLAGGRWASAAQVRDRIAAFVDETAQVHDDVAVLVVRATSVS
jgi:serine phosphatase RsbU (regulator of sigma subunit)/transcriptional regulator with GAF, ATPase, and Fis domain